MRDRQQAWPVGVRRHSPERAVALMASQRGGLRAGAHRPTTMTRGATTREGNRPPTPTPPGTRPVANLITRHPRWATTVPLVPEQRVSSTGCGPTLDHIGPGGRR